MTKTTNRNNDFQATLMTMLRNNGMTTNSELVLTEMPETGEIIIGKKRYFPPAPIVSAEPARTVYHLYNNYERDHEFLSLTPDQLRLLEWLSEEEFICCDWEWEEMKDVVVKKI